ncbi:MAG: hypothetical protein B7Z55_13300, partial [Planctomycetales bacterium 12-60-4]
MLVYLAAQSGVTELQSPAGGTAFVLADPKPGPNDWPGYRGPTQQGISTSSINWSALSGPAPSLARQTLVSSATSAPCLWGRQIFVVERGAPAAIDRLVSYERDTGRRLWEYALPTDPSTNQAGAVVPSRALSSLTPACDGEHVFVPTVAGGELR